jgi:hypothetical protein
MTTALSNSEEGVLTTRIHKSGRHSKINSVTLKVSYVRIGAL